MGEFDELLVRMVDKVIRYTLGDINANIIYDYLEKKSCPLQKIPEKLDVFSFELRNVLGTGRGQVLCPASILEETIAEEMCLNLGTKFEKGPIVFADYIRKLRETCHEVKVIG